MPMPRPLLTRAAILAGLCLFAGPALAHHPMGGAVPQTLWHGLLSGFAHPVIGPDHLAFLLAAGALATVRRGAALAALLGGTGLGAVLQLAGLALDPVEPLVALSVLLAGLALLRPLPARWGLLLPLGFALAGLAHGAAYAESIAGAPPATIIAYLLALSAMQASLALAGAQLLRSLATRVAAPRLVAGGAVAAVGALTLVQALAG
jgi:urease accessory protein